MQFVKRFVGVSRKDLTTNLLPLFRSHSPAWLLLPSLLQVNHKSLIWMTNLVTRRSRLCPSCLLSPSDFVLKRLQRAIVALCKCTIGIFSCCTFGIFSCCTFGCFSAGLLVPARILFALWILGSSSRATRIRRRSPSSTFAILCRNPLSSTSVFHWNPPSSPFGLFCIQQPVFA